MGYNVVVLTVDHCLVVHRLAAPVSMVHVEMFDFAIGSALGLTLCRYSTNLSAALD